MITSYISTPHELKFNEIWAKGSLSPSMYEGVECKNSNTKIISTLLEKPQIGKEVGSESYVEKSDYLFIRNRALKEFGFTLQKDSESILYVKPNVFKNYTLSKWNILYSKDSNIGECCIIESDGYKNHMISGGIIKLVAKQNPLYVFAFLKHSFVKAQLRSMTSKGVTIKHAGLKVLSCVIPYPKGKHAEKIISRVEFLTENIVRIETMIKDIDLKIYNIINEELKNNQKKPKTFVYHFPTIKDIEETERLDAGIYSKDYKEKMFKIKNYHNGFTSLTDPKLEFLIIAGPSLELKILKTRIDAETYQEGFYSLILPTNISGYGTLDKLEYLGTSKKIEQLQYGDIIIGESGTWRPMVLLYNYPKCITNAHGICIRHLKGDLVQSTFVGSILSWYYKKGIFDLLSVGGQGGHFSPIYFNRILIPNFPSDIKKKLFKLYYNEFNNSGLAQLNTQRIKFVDELNVLIDRIISDRIHDLDAL